MASSFDPALAGGSDVFCGCDYCGDNREADGFCTNCQDFLCTECFRTHLKPRLLRHHVLLDRDQMPDPEDRNRRGADSDTGSQNDATESSSLDEPVASSRRSRSEPSSHISDRPGNIGVPRSNDGRANYRPTHNDGRANYRPTHNDGRANYRPTQLSTCHKTATILVSAVLVLLLAVWSAGQHSREVIRKPQTNQHSRPVAGKTLAENVVDIAVIDDEEADKGSYGISGSVVMPGDKLVTVNPMSGRVKLIDLKTYTVVAQLDLPRTLWDITKINDVQVALSADNTQQIHFVNISDELKLDHSVQVNGKCTGITRLLDNLLVTYIDPAKVEILTMKGQLVQTVVTETQGKLLFVHPWYVAVSPDQSTIYISDWERNTVTRLSLAGEVLAMYQDKASLDKPHGLVVDKSGSVYVCGGHSHNVVQLAADLTKPRQLLQETDGIKYPESVSYCQTTDRWYIGMWGSRVVKVYQLRNNTNRP